MNFKLPKAAKIAEFMNVLSGILFFIIIVMIVFGCQVNVQEQFQNKKENFQNEIIDQVKGGKIDIKMIEQYIKEKKLSKDDLDAIIKAVNENVP
jgi:putative sterol carrier protein